MSLRVKGLVVVGIPMVAMLGMAVSSYLAERRSREADVASRRALAVVGLLGAVEAAGRQGQAEALRAAITGSLEARGRAEEALATIKTSMARLAQLETDDPQLVRSAQAALDEQVAGLDAMVAGGPPAPEAIATFGRGWDALAAELRAWREDEQEKLAAEMMRVDASRRLDFALGFGGLAVGLAGAAAAAILFTTGIARRMRSAAENAGRLVRGEPLLPAGASGDEVGRLALALEEAGDVLAEKERRAREAWAYLEDMFESGPVLVFRGDAGDWSALYVSPNVERVLGYSPEEIAGVPNWWLSHVHPDDHDAMLAAARRATEERHGEMAFEQRIRRRDGSYAWMYTLIRLEFDHTGSATGSIGYALDVSERRAAERARMESEARLKHLVSAGPAIIYSSRVGGDWGATFVSDNVAAQLGWEPSRFTEDAAFWASNIHPDDAPRVLAEIGRILEKGRHVHEYRFRCADGSWRWMHGDVRLVRGPGGEAVECVGSWIDVTGLVEERGALREREEDLRLLLESIDDVVYSVEVEPGAHPLEEGVTVAGEKVRGLLGRDPEEFARDPGLWFRLVHPDDLDGLVTTTRRLIAELRPVTRVYRMLHSATAEYVWIEDRAAPRLDAEGRLHRVFGVARDVTDRKRLERILSEAAAAAEASNRSKSEFLSRMSHELRTPLNAILGFAQLLELDGLDAEQHQGVLQILKAGRHLLELVNEVLDLARIETGRFAISVEAVALGDVVEECLDIVRHLAAARRVELLAGGDGHAGRTVLADRQRLKQVLINLLSNAVKHNREGGSVALSFEELPDGWERVGVTDTGPGIAPGDVDRAFAPFERLGAEQRGVEGVGIGLALARSLTEAMGGKIGARSAPGEGSTFWVDLPLVAAEAAPAGNAAAAPARTILYIEDNLLNLRIVERACALRDDVKIVAATQGELGLEVAIDRRPDLVLLDLHLPDVPGREVLLRLKADPRTRDIPAVVISADPTPGEDRRLLAAGARAFLPKPIDLERFLEVVDEALAAGT